VANSNPWLILELNELGESCNFAELNYTLNDMLGVDVEYFIPIHSEKMGSYTSTSVLFEGYVFVKDSNLARQKLDNLKDYKIFSRILESGGRFQTVSSRTIGVLRRKLKASIHKKVKAGTRVRILDGIFENLVGEVVSIEDNGKKMMVRIKRLSREIIAPLPSTSVVVVERDEF
jgi:transcription antitermination factor NusG